MFKHTWFVSIIHGMCFISNVLQACAAHVASRLGPSRQLIGVATLRALDVTGIPENFLEEALGGESFHLKLRIQC